MAENEVQVTIQYPNEMTERFYKTMDMKEALGLFGSYERELRDARLEYWSRAEEHLMPRWRDYKELVEESELFFTELPPSTLRVLDFMLFTHEEGMSIYKEEV